MAIIETTVEISKPPAEVRAIVSHNPQPQLQTNPQLINKFQVMDFAQMPKWHTSFLKTLKPLPEGTAPLDMKKGDDMLLKFLATTVTCKCYVNLPSSTSYTFPNPLTSPPSLFLIFLPDARQANSPTELAWEGGPGMLFHGIHSIKFEELDGGAKTLVRHGEKFTGLFGEGVALPGIKGQVARLYEGFNQDLKRRCEEGK